MDELELNLDTVSDADANLEVEGAEAQIEDIQNRYPDEDYRTPEEQALEAEQAEGTAETVEPVETAETAETVEPEVVEEPVTYSPNRFQEDPTTGLVNVEEVLATGVDPTLAKMANIQYQYGDDERQAFEEYHKAGGDINLEATLKLVNTIRNDELLSAKYDRNGDGQVSFSDWFDVSRMGEITPEREAILTEQWLTSLENKDFKARLGAIANLNPMIPYYHQRRKGILGPEDELDGEQLRASSIGGLQQTVGDFLSGFEKVTAGFAQSEKYLGTGDDWFNEDAFETKDAKLDDWILNHKNPQSLSYAIANPVNRVWSDPLMFELGRYSPAIAASFFYPGAATNITMANPAGFLATGGKAIAFTWATETIPTNIFTDLNTNAMKTFHGTKETKAILNAHPEMEADALKLAYGQEGAFSRKLEFMRGEMGWDAGGLLAGNILFRSLGKVVGHGANTLAPKQWQRLQTSLNAKPKNPQTPLDIWNARTQVADDTIEAAIDQTKMAAEGPASKWQDGSGTDADLDSTYGPFKNQRTTNGQGTAPIRSDISEVVDQVDEIRGQVGIEGGTVDEIFTPIERAEFSKGGIPDPWIDNAATNKFWNTDNVQSTLKNLPPENQNLGNLFKGSLETIKEVLGRDASQFTNGEFFNKKFLETKFKPGETLDSTKKWFVKNLAVSDAVINSTTKRLRDYADAAGELLGKGDVFAKGGVMDNIRKNLSLGLTEVNKTKFKWDLATKKMLESNGELTAKQIREIDKLVDGEQLKMLAETNNGIKMMMDLLEGADSDELAEGILDIFKMSDSIRTIEDFNAFMRSKVRGGDFTGEVKPGMLLGEGRAVMINSVLSGPKTPLRALMGTTTNSYLNAINEVVGASIKTPFTGDIASRTASIAKLKGMFELVPESFTFFRKTFKSKWNADIADIRTRFSEGPTRGDESWNAVAKWTERHGTVGDKAAFYAANVARNLNNNKLLTWSPRVMSSIDETFKHLMVRARAKEIGFREALEAAGGNFDKLTPDILKEAENNYLKRILDANDNVDFGKDSFLKKQFEEITLTSPLKGIAGELDTVFKKAPLIQPFYLFARTGINGLNFTYKNTPLLGALHKESIDILSHRGDDFTKLKAKYGIENANDLANARNLFAGRQAVGAATVMTFAGMYQAGQLTGNGPADKGLKQNWINAGWKPNHFYVGDVGFDYSGLEPYNTIFSAIADVGDNIELMGSEWAEKRLQAMAFVIGRGLTSKTYMSGLDQMMQMAQFKPGAWEKGAGNIMNNSIPLAGMRNEFGKWINPHMKELNSDMWDSIRNRNQFLEPFAGDKLPEKSDILNGKPIRNWNIIGRSFNAISPIQMDVRSSSPGRKLLLDSNYDLKSTTYAYGGYSFTKNAKIRAHFQNAIGTVPITVGYKKFKNVEEALNYLATRQDVKNSMAQMKANVNNPASYDINPNTYPHNTLIDNVMNQARSKAWAKLKQPTHPGYADLQQLMSEKDGHTTRTRENRNEILELSFPRRTIQNSQRN